MGEDEQLLEAAAADDGGALATVLAVSGSAYRREGARMLVRPDGTTVGGVSGGCLEAEVAAEALEAAAAGRSRVLRFDTTTPEDAVMGYGSGCAGVIDVLVEPRGPLAADLALSALAEVRATRQAGVLVTASAGPLTGAHGWWHAGRWSGALAPHVPAAEASAHLAGRGASRGAGGAGRATVPTVTGMVPVAWEVLEPPVRLVHVGADAGAPEMARAARQLGWEVVVVDFRPRLLEPARFPPGTRLLELGGADLAAGLPIDAGTAVVVASRHWLYDLPAVEAAVSPGGASAPGYVGLIGSRARVEGLLSDVLGGRERPAAVHAPAGMALGARTPAEIAVAVVAEVLARRSRTTAPLLPVHGSTALTT